MDKQCTGLGKVFGHKYEPRYSMTYEWPETASFKNLELLTDDSILALKITSESYHGDVCTRCGDTKQNTNHIEES